MIASFNATVARIISTISRKVRISSSKKFMAVLLLALIEKGLQQGDLPKIRTRSFQRAAHVYHIAQSTLKEIVSRAISGDILLLVRPFSIDIQRVQT